MATCNWKCGSESEKGKGIVWEQTEGNEIKAIKDGKLMKWIFFLI